MSKPCLSVIIPTRNPDVARLKEVLDALASQLCDPGSFEVCIVDNGSVERVNASVLGPLAGSVVREERAGLLWARVAGIRATTAELLVFIDDDTVPAHDFVRCATSFMSTHPRVGTAGGRILPRFLTQPPEWVGEVGWALALRDSGDSSLEWSLDDREALPNWTPIGAGLLVRRAAVVGQYLTHVERNHARIAALSWRGQGCGGVEDKDLVLFVLRMGWSTAYVPSLCLTHIIPPERLRREYFEKLLPALGFLWARTLHAHGFPNFPSIDPWTLLPRKMKAWFVMRAWSSLSRRLCWLSMCGHLEGMAAARRDAFKYPPVAREAPALGEVDQIAARSSSGDTA